MVPERISELEDIVLHHDCESFGEGIGGDIGEVVFALVDEAADLDEGGGGVYVGVHAGRVGDEEACAGWEIKGEENINKGSAIAEVGWLHGGYFVEMEVDPDS